MVPEFSYPLEWPGHWPRTETEKRSAFATSMVAARQELVSELRLLKATSAKVTANMYVNRDGSPSFRQSRQLDNGVAVYFTVKGDEKVIACDRWDMIHDNMRAISKTLNALRGIERWGTATMVSTAMQGYAAIPEKTSGEAWWDVLGFGSPATSRAAIDEHYREIAKELHPDKGGDPDRWYRLNQAYNDARRAVPS